MPQFDVAVIGHLTVDHIERGGRVHQSCGGPACYTSIASAMLEARVTVCSKVGFDFPSLYLRRLARNGIDVSRVVLENDLTTTKFRLLYRKSTRKLWLLSRCGNLEIELLEGINARIFYLGAVAGELPRETVKVLRRSDSLIAIDPQGFLRLTKLGKVRVTRVMDMSMIRSAWFVRASLEEGRVMTNHSDPRSIARTLRGLGPDFVAISMGQSGVVLSCQGGEFFIPSFRTRVVDETGAGDVFAGGFMAEFLREPSDEVWCAAMGSGAASCIVEKPGPEGFGNRRKVESRAYSLYEKARWL